MNTLGKSWEIETNIVSYKISCREMLKVRQRISWLAYLRQRFRVTSAELFRCAVHEVRIVMMIANIWKAYYRRSRFFIELNYSVQCYGEFMFWIVKLNTSWYSTFSYFAVWGSTNIFLDLIKYGTEKSFQQVTRLFQNNLNITNDRTLDQAIREQNLQSRE